MENVDKVMKVSVTPGKTYAVTTSEECTITSADGTTIATCVAGEQTVFVAPSSAVDVSSDTAVVVESFRSASTGGKVSRGYIQDAIEEATAGLPQVDASGNMTLEGGLTTAGAINANGGINVPLTADMADNSSIINRANGIGLGLVSDLFSTDSFLTTETLYGDGCSVEKAVPGLWWKLKKTGSENGTVRIAYTSPFFGVDSYNGWAGFVLPISFINFGSTAGRKISFVIGRAGDIVITTASGLDDYTVSPKSTNMTAFPRFFDVTISATNDTSTTPNGYQVRVRQIKYNTTKSTWEVTTTTSIYPSFNNFPDGSLFLTLMQDKSTGNASMWIGSNGHSRTPRLLKIADVSPLADSYQWYGLNTIYWDCGAIATNVTAFTNIGKIQQIIVQGNSGINGAYSALKSIEHSYIQSTTTTDFTPYE